MINVTDKNAWQHITNSFKACEGVLGTRLLGCWTYCMQFGQRAQHDACDWHPKEMRDKPAVTLGCVTALPARVWPCERGWHGLRGCHRPARAPGTLSDHRHGAPGAEARPGTTGNTANKAMAFTRFNRKMVKTGRWAAAGKGSEGPWEGKAQGWAAMEPTEILGCISNAVQEMSFAFLQVARPVSQPQCCTDTAVGSELEPVLCVLCSPALSALHCSEKWTFSSKNSRT